MRERACARACAQPPSRPPRPRDPTTHPPPPHPPASDPPTKELILALNAARPTGDKFVIDDLDEGALLVAASAVDAIKARVAAAADEVAFVAPPRGVGE